MSDQSFDDFYSLLRHEQLVRRIASQIRIRKQRTKRARRPKRGPVSTDVKAIDVPDAAGMLADPCSYCGGKAAAFDHIEPISKGGANEYDNLARACWRCNSAKNSLRLVVFLARRAAGRDNRDTAAHDSNAPPQPPRAA